MDGTIFPWEAISSFNLAEVLRYHAVVDLFVAPLFTLMNQKRYDSLPPDLRKVIDDLSGAWGSRLLLRWRWPASLASTCTQATGMWSCASWGQRPSARWLTTC